MSLLASHPYRDTDQAAVDAGLSAFNPYGGTLRVTVSKFEDVQREHPARQLHVCVSTFCRLVCAAQTTEGSRIHDHFTLVRSK